jgi:hypothetical protein
MVINRVMGARMMFTNVAPSTKPMIPACIQFAFRNAMGELTMPRNRPVRSMKIAMPTMTLAWTISKIRDVFIMWIEITNADTV